jgi:hypothetical protein
MLEATMVDGQRPALCMMEANWLQTVEGDLDTVHLGFLHLGSVTPEASIPGSYDYYMVKDRQPHYAIMETDVGTSYGAYRPAEADTTYWRIAHFMFPFWALIPTGDLGQVVRAQAWVPLDDHHTMYWGWQVTGSNVGRGGQTATATNAGTGRPLDAAAPVNRTGFEYAPGNTGWLGRYLLDQNKENDYQIDREAQAQGKSFTGIRGVRQQDKAVGESMGPIMDRTNEHLGTSDAMIIRTRRKLMASAKALAEEGIAPPGVDTPHGYRHRSGSIILPRDADWLESTEHLRHPQVGIGEPAVAR